MCISLCAMVQSVNFTDRCLFLVTLVDTVKDGIT